MPDRVMVFIDGANLYSCIRKAFGRTDFDVGKIGNKLVSGRELVRIYYYNAPIDPVEDPGGSRDQQKFFAALGWIPYLEKRMGKLLPRETRHRCPNCNRDNTYRTHVQKGVDTRICIDIVTLAVRETYDVGIVVSGDSDLTEAVHFVKEFPRKRIENAFTLEGWAPDLRAEADVKIIIDAAFLADCWRNRP